MPRIISGLRVARSYVTPAGTTAVERTLDFQLGARQGIQIEQMVGSIEILDVIESTDTDNYNGNHTLHLESGSLEVVADAAAEDEDTIDSEIIYRQGASLIVQEEAATRGGSAVAFMVDPTSPIIFSTPLFVARNPTHRGITKSTNFSVGCHLTIYYKFVEFSLGELGLILARRT